MDRPVNIQEMIDFGDEIDTWFNGSRAQALNAIDYPGVLFALSTVFTALRESSLPDSIIGPALLSVFKAGVFVGTRLSSGWEPGPEDDSGLGSQLRNGLTNEELDLLYFGSPEHGNGDD